MRQPNCVFRGGGYPFLSHAFGPFGLAKPTSIGLHFAGQCTVAFVNIRIFLRVVNEVMNKDHGTPSWKFTFRWICFGLKVDPMFFCKHINLVWKTVVLSLRVISGTLGKHGLWTHWPCCFSNAQMVIVEHRWKTTKPARVRHRHRQTRSKVVVSKCFWFSNWDIHQDTTFAKGLQCQQSKKYRVFGIALFGFRTERFQPDAHKCQGQWTGFALCHLGNSLDVPRISWISHHDRWKSTTQLMHLGKHYCGTCHVG